MASHYEAPIRKPLVTGNKSYHDVSIDIAGAVEGKANKQWWIVFSIALVMFLWGLGCIIYTIATVANDTSDTSVRNFHLNPLVYLLGIAFFFIDALPF